MDAMTTRERVGRMFAHKDADRIPVWEGAWGSTQARWKSEGMTGDYVDYFDLDRIVLIYRLDTSPQLPEETLSETDKQRTYRTAWGSTLRNWKQRESVPEFIEPGMHGPDEWSAVKERLGPNDNRIPWNWLKEHWPRWREQGAWIMFSGWFGFDVTHSKVLGTEESLIALIEEPEWLVDIWQAQLELNLALLDRVWEAGYEFDALRWPDDMGYKNAQFFSLSTYRELLKPIHKQAIDWAHAKGIPAYLHSCGNVQPFVSELVEMGLDALNPLEVKAGMDPLEVKRAHGDRLVLHGGFNALDWQDMDAMAASVESRLPALMESGGYIFATDHSTPSDVGLNDFRRIVELVKWTGTY